MAQPERSANLGEVNHSVQIRERQGEDELNQVVNLLVETGLVIPEKIVEARIDARMYPVLVAVKDGQVVGCIFVGPKLGISVFYFAVTEEDRRQGIGTKLVYSAEDRLRSAGNGRCVLEVKKGDPGLFKFYGNIGYKQVDQQQSRMIKVL